MTITDDPSLNHHPMRAECSKCRSTDGILITVGGQDTVRCAKCDTYCYNAPRTETGRPARSLRTRPQVRPSQRKRILERDRRACFACNRSDRPLELGHIISVHEGRAQGLSDAELFHDDNLVALCPECNSGQGSATMPLPFLVAVLRMADRQVPMSLLIAVLRVRTAMSRREATA
jgi:5-methylcytosine-specific restriction endonuclease McrA